MARPNEYNQTVATEICSRLAEGISLRTVCLADDMPDKATVFRWIRENKEFHDQYASAKEESADAQNEMLLDLGDEAIEHAYRADPKASGAVVQAVKLKADNLKWVMSKMKPKKYGDKIDMTTNGKDLPIPILGNVQNNIGNNEDPSSK